MEDPVKAIEHGGFDSVEPLFEDPPAYSYLFDAQFGTLGKFFVAKH